MNEIDLMNDRNSAQLVEASFDGDFEEVKRLVDMGYHIESVDGRKHTALSEAAAQGHLDLMSFLLEQGADPNALSDTNRSPLWRAAFNGHTEAVKILLQSGGSPSHIDSVSLESPFDVSKNDEIRELLTSWDMNVTDMLMLERKRLMNLKIEERIKSSVEREEYARKMIRNDLVEKAEKGDFSGVKEMLMMIAEEAESTGQSPRGSAECRNEQGQSLLSIAAQHDHAELASFLLTHWRSFLDPPDHPSIFTKVFKTNPNSRDLKGWNCVCIAIFHDSTKVLRLLLEHGGDPYARSSYNKCAWDLAKDEVDAAERIVKSKAELRQILMDHEKSTVHFGGGKVRPIISADGINLYKDLEGEGTAMVMNIEMNNDASAVEGRKKKIKKKKLAK